MGEGRPPRRPHIRSPREGRPPRRPHFRRSERVYPAIMPFGAISPGDPSWRKASRYVRTGRDDLRVVRTATVPNRGVSACGGLAL
jgi:hypothetical protein